MSEMPAETSGTRNSAPGGSRVTARAVGRRRILGLGALAVPAIVMGCGARDTPIPGRAEPATDPRPHTTSPVRSGATISTASTTVVDPDEYAGRVPQQWGTDLPGIVSTLEPGPDGTRTIALTFDACGGPHGSNVDTEVLTVLSEYAVPATLFLNERWIRANPAATEQFVADPLLRVENHGSGHMPLSVTGREAYGIAGTRNAAEVIDEIASNRALLRSFGVNSGWFRAGTAHYDDVAVSIARDLGVGIAGFSVNADFGATASATTVEQQLLGASDGAIVLAHMNQPESGTAAGLRAAIPALVAGGVKFVHLDGSAL